MLKSIERMNIRRHVRTRVEFQKLTVLAGPNGSGKTTVLDALAMMARGALRDPEWMQHWVRAGASQGRILVDEDGEPVSRGWPDPEGTLEARNRLSETRVVGLGLDPRATELRAPCERRQRSSPTGPTSPRCSRT